MAADRAKERCDQCGQVDDHPKSHGPGTTPWFDNGAPVLGPDGVQLARYTTKHHDCLSADEEVQLVGSAQPEGTVAATAIVAKAKAGVHGDDLRQFIETEHGKAAKRLEKTNG